MDHRYADAAAPCRAAAPARTQLAPAAQAAALLRLRALLGLDADPAALETELCRRIADGRLPADDPALLDHLWAGTLARLAIDQPSYAPYRDEIAPKE